MTPGLIMILESSSELQELITLLYEQGPIDSSEYSLPEDWTPFIDEAVDEYQQPYFVLTKRGEQLYEISADFIKRAAQNALPGREAAEKKFQKGGLFKKANPKAAYGAWVRAAKARKLAGA